MIHSGYKSKGEYLVWDLFDFGRGADQSNLSGNMRQRICKPHVSTRCELYGDVLHYELKAAYELVNHTYDGQRDPLKRHPLKGGRQTDAPPPHVDMDGGGNSAIPQDEAVVEPSVAEVPVPVAPYPHMSEGKASDKRIYLNDLGKQGDVGKEWSTLPCGC